MQVTSSQYVICSCGTGVTILNFNPSTGVTCCYVTQGYAALLAAWLLSVLQDDGISLTIDLNSARADQLTARTESGVLCVWVWVGGRQQGHILYSSCCDEMFD
jgi:hypothetical protein